MQKAAKPLKKFAVVIRIQCSTWWHFWHYIDKAFIIEATSVDGIDVQAVHRQTGESQRVRVIAVAPVMGEGSVNRV